MPQCPIAGDASGGCIVDGAALVCTAVSAGQPTVLASAVDPLHRVSIVRAPVARRCPFGRPPCAVRVDGQDDRQRRAGDHPRADHRGWLVMLRLFTRSKNGNFRSDSLCSFPRIHRFRPMYIDGPHMYGPYVLPAYTGAFLQRAQCSHCKRCISYSNSVCPSVRLSVRHTPVLCQNDGT